MKKYKKKLAKKGVEYGYNYEHFIIADNLSISDKALKIILRTYDRLSVWFKREILGLRVATEGVIYEQYANREDKFIIDKLTQDELNKIQFIIIGIDFGGNKSGHAFTAVGINRGFKGITILSDYWSDKHFNPEQLDTEFIKFVKNVKLLKRPIKEARADSANQVLIRGFRTALLKAKIALPIKNAIKGEINERIKFVQRCMAVGAFKVAKNCIHTREALREAVWANTNKMDDKRLDDGTSNIDNLDSMEYGIEPQIKTLIRTLGLMK